MCSYNAINGVPTCADPYILQNILRDHWNWTDDGQYVTSDCDAIQNIYMPHDYTPTRQQAVADALIAGTDLNCVRKNPFSSQPLRLTGLGYLLPNLAPFCLPSRVVQRDRHRPSINSPLLRSYQTRIFRPCFRDSIPILDVGGRRDAASRGSCPQSRRRRNSFVEK